MHGIIGTLLAVGSSKAAVPLGGYRHLTSTTPQGQAALNTELLTDFDTAVIAQTRLAGELGERLILGFELPLLAQARSEQPTPWGGRHVELRVNPITTYDQARGQSPRRAVCWDLGVEMSLPWGAESQAGFWAITPLEAVNWHRRMVALRTTRPIGDHAWWQTYVAAGTLHSEQRLLAGQATLTASRYTKQGMIVGELDFNNTPLANALSVTGLARRALTPQLDASIGLNLPLSKDIRSSLQVVSQLRLHGQAPTPP